MAGETPPPLSDERLNEIRDHISPGHWLIAQHERRQILERDISTLLAEVDRLRARESALQDAVKYQDNFLVRALPGEEYAFVARMVRRLLGETPPQE